MLFATVMWGQCVRPVSYTHLLAVVVLSKFWTEIPVLPLCGVFVLLGLLTALTAAFFLRKVTEKETAETADALGGAERMITTIELLGKGTQNPVEEMAVADGFAKAKETDFAKLYRMRLPVDVYKRQRCASFLGIFEIRWATLVPLMTGKEGSGIFSAFWHALTTF